ncbi:MAG: alpha/beta hydrolase fold domain-containing protein, partial [Novosphingobium sp.]
MRISALLAISAVTLLSAGADAAPPRDFVVADHPLSEDVALARPRLWPGGVTSLSDVRYAANSGWRRQTVDIYMPPKKAGPKPLVLYIHGGGWMNGDSRHFGSLADFPAVAARLASEGFVVAAVEYRHAAEARFPSQVQDIRAALRFLKGNAAKYGIDSARTGLIGGSAGAHLAAIAAFSCGDGSLDAAGTKAEAGSECVQALVGWYGVYDVPALNAARTAGRDSAIDRLLGCDGPCA